MIWPEFISEDGELISSDIQITGTCRARMYIVVPEMKEKVHNQRIKEGGKFYMVEGPLGTAKGIITKGLT